VRNYISLYVVRWIQHIFSGGVEIFSGPATAAGGDPDDLNAQINFQDIFMMNSLGGDAYSNEFPNEPQQVFICFDKETVLRMMQNVDRSGTSVPVYLWDAITVAPEQQIIRNVTKTPRYHGWTDSAGVVRKPPPSDLKLKRGDFSGVPGLFTFLQNLPAYAQILKREGRLRDAGIVLELYNQVIDGRQSLTDALAILRQNGL
jgi:hypothetical protein